MGNYEKLKKLVEDKAVKIYYELSLPRSNSTAWQIALCEAPEIHGQINEPSFHSDLKARRFNDQYKSGDRTFEDYCGRILSRLEGDKDAKKQGLLTATDQRPVGLVINDLVGCININELEKILALTDKVAITVRDPCVQIHSALTRVINDTLDSPGGGNISPKMALDLSNKINFTEQDIKELTGPGKDKINPTRILAFLKQVEGFTVTTESLTPELLTKAVKLAVESCKNEYIDICWDNLKQQVAFIRRYEKTSSEFTVIIVDGSDLVKYPIDIMKQSAKALGVTYTTEMVDGWKKGTGNNFHCCITEGWGELATTNQWNGPARTSTKLEQKPSSISERPDISQFPALMRKGIEDALVFYNELVKQKLKLNIEYKRENSKNEGVHEAVAAYSQFGLLGLSTVTSATLAESSNALEDQKVTAEKMSTVKI